MNLSHIKDPEGINIDFTSSFNLFNESFDIESILGPNTSFGFGHMRSLSFGLGGLSSASVDQDRSRSSPKIHIQNSEACRLEMGSGDNGINNGSSSSMYRDPSLAVTIQRNKARKVACSDCTAQLPSRPMKENLRSHRIEKSLFGAIERHFAVFNSFSFLLPGAKAFFSKESRYAQLSMIETKVARRRVNSALCAFGGSVIPLSDSRMQEHKQVPARYYEGESRLSREIEEAPAIEASGFNADENSKLSSAGCPCKASLQRDIGVMIYPAVNAFTATEPGIITDTFVNQYAIPKTTPAKSSLNQLSIGPTPVVSPDSIYPSNNPLSISPHSETSVNYAGGAWISNQKYPQKGSQKKETRSQPTDLLFVKMQELRPEQHRTVAQKKRKLSETYYRYPALPLPYGQRKRISNAMFALSKNIPGLTDECASVLGEARRKDAWDLAVAQLMTQVVVITHCSAGDRRLDGLSKYLLTLG